MQVAIALSLLVTQVTGPPFHNTVCTFSATPQLHEVVGGSLVKKVGRASMYTEYDGRAVALSSTDCNAQLHTTVYVRLGSTVSKLTQRSKLLVMV